MFLGNSGSLHWMKYPFSPHDHQSSNDRCRLWWFLNTLSSSTLTKGFFLLSYIGQVDLAVSLDCRFWNPLLVSEKVFLSQQNGSWTCAAPGLGPTWFISWWTYRVFHCNECLIMLNKPILYVASLVEAMFSCDKEKKIIVDQFKENQKQSMSCWIKIAISQFFSVSKAVAGSGFYFYSCFHLYF